MGNKELNEILNLLGKKIKEKSDNLKVDLKNIYSILVSRKNGLVKEFKEDIGAKWNEFKKLNENRIIKKTYTTFFYNNFYDYYKFFLKNFFGLNDNSLVLLSKEKISETNLIIEFKYNLSEEELDFFDKTLKLYEKANIGLNPLIGHFFSLCRNLGEVLKETINEPFYIIQDGGVINYEDKNKFLKLMIVIRDNKEEIFFNYLNLVLFYFLKQFKNIPEKSYKRLLKGRERLYEIALKEYPLIKEKLIDLLYYFYMKCRLVKNFTPFLDFLNFICSRIEDSLFSKTDIIKKEFLNNLEYTEEMKNSLLRIFNFLDQKSTLYSTFQANNLPSPKAQFNLFILYMRYYFFSGLEALEVGDLLYLPGIFKTALNQYYLEENRVINTSSIDNIKNFINLFVILRNINNVDLFIQKIFKKELSELNYEFFKSFLNSFNTRISMIIDDENHKIKDDPKNQPITFNLIVDHMCRMVYTLIDNVFLRSNPNEASKNFIDPRGRYKGKNIALRVLELFLFQDMNFSDDIWPEFMISLHKEKIQENYLKNFRIPDKSFYTDESLLKLLIETNFVSKSEDIFFEDWILSEIIIPLDNFFQEIKKSVKDPSNRNEVSEKLIEIMLENVDDQGIIREFEFVCRHLAPLWAELK